MPAVGFLQLLDSVHIVAIFQQLLQDRITGVGEVLEVAFHGRILA